MRRFAPLILWVLPVFAWGPTGHAIIITNAIELCPAEIKPFCWANSHYLVALCTLPDDLKQIHRKTGNQHFIGLDMLDKGAFKDVAGERWFGKEKLAQEGVSPWTIQERNNKHAGVMKEAALQSAMRVPLHVTHYYGGRVLEQNGAHNCWKEILPMTISKDELVKPGQPQRIGNVLVSVFGWVVSSYEQFNRVLAVEDKAWERDPGHAYSYYKVLYAESGVVLRGQLEDSAEALAGVYIKAWQDAGRPHMPDKTAPL